MCSLCRNLIICIISFASGVPTSRSRFGAVPADFALDDVQCEGSEESLFDCLHSPDSNCGANEGAGVICQGRPDMNTIKR